jgi:hypothetical protein
MRENRRLLRLSSLVLVGALAVPAVMLLPVPLAHADQAAPDPDRVRRRLMWGAVALSGIGLFGSLYAHSRYQRDIDMFNRFQGPAGDPTGTPDGRCAVNAPNRGAPPCAEILSGAERAHTAFQISLAVAGAAAVTALTLKLLEPDAPKRHPAAERWALACAPMPGAGGTCTLRF